MFALLIGACGDPPDPPRPPSPYGSTAPYVEWRAADAPVRGPVALVRDRPGGRVDRLIADRDVTTFLNDRFHPIFEASSAPDERGTLAFLDGCGCPLTPAFSPQTAAEIIARANEVVVRTEARRCEGRPFSRSCTDGTPKTGAD